MCIYTNLKKTRVIFKRMNLFILFLNDARLSRVHDASITLPCYSIRLTNLDAREKRLVWH